MPRSREPEGLEEVNLLDLVPVRLADWREAGDRVVLLRPKPPSPLKRPFEWLAQTLAPRRLRLDEIGSYMWKQLEGGKTAGQIAQAVRQEFDDAVEPVEERLGVMLRTLRREGLIGYEGWDDRRV